MLRRIALPHNVGPDGYIVPPARTPGLHLSGVLKYIAKVTKITKYLEEIAEEEHPLRWFLGQIWEEGWASLYPGMVWQPGEMTDPTIGTCDGLSDEPPYGIVIEECKFRRAKRLNGKDLLSKNWLFAQQGLGYANGYGTPYVRWNVMSAFEWPDPAYTRYLFKFDESELQASRRMIESNADAARKAGYAE